MHLFLTILVTVLLYAAGTVFYLNYAKKKEPVSVSEAVSAGKESSASEEKPSDPSSDSAVPGESSAEVDTPSAPEDDVISVPEDDKPSEKNAEENAKETIPAAPSDNSKTGRNSLLYLGIMAVLTIGLAVWLNLYYKDNLLLTNLKAVTLIAILAVAALTDFRKHLIPNELIIAGVGLRLVYAILEFILMKMDYIQILKGDLFSLVLPLALLLLGVFVIKNGVGMGDVKLLAVIGIFAGISGAIPSLFFALVIAFFLSIVLMIMKKKGRKDTIAFAPSLLAGTFVAIVLTGF